MSLHGLKMSSQQLPSCKLFSRFVYLLNSMLRIPEEDEAYKENIRTCLEQMPATLYICILLLFPIHRPLLINL